MSDSRDGQGQAERDEQPLRPDDRASGGPRQPGKDSVVPAARAGNEIRRHLNAEQSDDQPVDPVAKQASEARASDTAPASETPPPAPATAATPASATAREQLSSRLDGTGPDRVAIAILVGIIVILAICVVLALAAR